MGCLDEDGLHLLLDGAVDDDRRAEIEAHLDACDHCRRLVAAAARDDDDAVAAGALLLANGTRLSRYVILEVVGSGAMGVIYAAYDPELDRKVAIKVLRPGTESAGGDREKRVLREAQAMARLTHPNVVAVHDVGMVSGQVFLVMEFARGTTLREWLMAERRPWRDVVSLFCRAGAGLAAAHAAGLVHRDFKPENVLVEASQALRRAPLAMGRVLVTDFGLARSVDAHPAATGDPGVVVVDRLSRSGAVIGTPAYMAPEQIRGETVDRRADVFSFCVALYEALYGERPFAGETVDEVKGAILSGRVREPPADAAVPGWVRKVVLSGLVADPTRRAASIEELTRVLEPAPVSSRSVSLAAVVAACVAALVAVLSSRAPEPNCRGAERKLAGVWDADRRQAVSRALLASGKPGAESTALVVESTLNRYAADWVRMRTEACEATHVAGEQSQGLLDRRMWCLDERLEEVRELTELLSKPDDQLLNAAAKAAYSISPLGPCADTKALLAPVPMPSDPPKRAEIDALGAALARAKAMRSLGRFREGEQLAGNLSARAHALEYPPLEADVLDTWGDFLRLVADYPRAAETLLSALQAAERGNDRKLAAQAMIDLEWVVGNEVGDATRAHEYGSHAAALLEGLGGDVELEARLARSEGATFYIAGRFGEAESAFRKSVEKQRAATGATHPAYATALVNLGLVLGDEEKHAEALDLEERALESFRDTVGEHHPVYAAALYHVSDELRLLGRIGEARATAEQSLAIAEAALGPTHAHVAWAARSLGLVALEEGRRVEAVSALERSLSLVERLHGPDHPFVAQVASDLAQALVEATRNDEAVALCRRAIAIDARHGKDRRRTARFASLLGAALLAADKPTEASAAFEAALPWQEAHAESPRELADTRFGLGRALWATNGGDRDRARRLAAKAIEGYAQAGPAANNARAAAEAWLASRGASHATAGL
jgi:tetratricopeptide (TPR) repeat protein